MRPYLGKFIGRQNFPELLSDYLCEIGLIAYRSVYINNQKEKKDKALLYFLGAYPELTNMSPKIDHIKEEFRKYYLNYNLTKSSPSNLPSPYQNQNQNQIGSSKKRKQVHKKKSKKMKKY